MAVQAQGLELATRRAPQEAPAGWLERLPTLLKNAFAGGPVAALPHASTLPCRLGSVCSCPLLGTVPFRETYLSWDG